MAQKQIINPKLKEEVFNGIERKGEQLKDEFKQLLKFSEKQIDSQINTSKFEAAYAFSLSKEERRKTMREVREVRKELWKEALKKAEGNKQKAKSIYGGLCAFP